MCSRNMKEKKGYSVNHVTLETMSYDEFDKFRKKYLINYYPFNTFGCKEEKQNVKQKIQSWFNSTTKMKKDETKDIEDNQKLTKDSKKKSFVFKWVGRAISNFFGY